MKLTITRAYFLAAMHQGRRNNTFQLVCEGLTQIIESKQNASSTIHIFPDYEDAQGESTAIKDVIHDFLTYVPNKYKKIETSQEERTSRMCTLISLLYKAISAQDAQKVDFYFHYSNASTQMTSPLMDVVLRNQLALAKVLIEDCRCTFNPRDRVEHADMLEKVAAMRNGWLMLELIAPLVVDSRRIDNPHVFYDEGVPWDELSMALSVAIERLSVKSVTVLIHMYGADVNSAERVEHYQALVRSVVERKCMPQEHHLDKWRRASIIYKDLEQKWKAIVAATGVFEKQILDGRVSAAPSDHSRRERSSQLALLPYSVYKSHIAPLLLQPRQDD